MTRAPASSYSSFVIHILRKIGRDERIEPPIQTEVSRSGGAEIATYTTHSRKEYSLVWSGLVWSGLIGLIGLIWCGVVWCGVVWSIWSGLVWSGLVWSDLVWPS